MVSPKFPVRRLHFHPNKNPCTVVMWPFLSMTYHQIIEYLNIDFSEKYMRGIIDAVVELS